MLLTVDLETFAVEQSGFTERPSARGAVAFTSAGLALDRIEALAEAEYGQAVVVDGVNRVVSFGRDFLGHHPLSYACTADRLYVSDSARLIEEALVARGGSLSLSAEAIALFLTMGYVPHGYSVYREIVNCRATGFYTWRKGSVRRTEQFVPVD